MNAAITKTLAAKGCVQMGPLFPPILGSLSRAFYWLNLTRKQREAQNLDLTGKHKITTTSKNSGSSVAVFVCTYWLHPRWYWDVRWRRDVIFSVRDLYVFNVILQICNIELIRRKMTRSNLRFWTLIKNKMYSDNFDVICILYSHYFQMTHFCID